MRACWQFKNGTMCNFQDKEALLQAAAHVICGDAYVAWDRSLGGYVYYAR
jgi:hypothetical protein